MKRAERIKLRSLPITKLVKGNVVAASHNAPWYEPIFIEQERKRKEDYAARLMEMPKRTSVELISEIMNGFGDRDMRKVSYAEAVCRLSELIKLFPEEMNILIKKD